MLQSTFSFTEYLPWWLDWFFQESVEKNLLEKPLSFLLQPFSFSSDLFFYKNHPQKEIPALTKPRVLRLVFCILRACRTTGLAHVLSQNKARDEQSQNDFWGSNWYLMGSKNEFYVYFVVQVLFPPWYALFTSLRAMHAFHEWGKFSTIEFGNKTSASEDLERPFLEKPSQPPQSILEAYVVFSVQLLPWPDLELAKSFEIIQGHRSKSSIWGSKCVHQLHKKSDIFFIKFQ